MKKFRNFYNYIFTAHIVTQNPTNRIYTWNFFTLYSYVHPSQYIARNLTRKLLCVIICIIQCPFCIISKNTTSQCCIAAGIFETIGIPSHANLLSLFVIEVLSKQSTQKMGWNFPWHICALCLLLVWMWLEEHQFVFQLLHLLSTGPIK